MTDRPSPRPPSPRHPWSGRVDAARALIESQAPAPTVLAGVDRIDTALVDAATDLDRLQAALAQLDERTATAELKAALRARPDPTAADTPLIASLRRRRHTFHGLRNRLRSLLDDVEGSLSDLDALAARCVEEAHTRGSRLDRGALADEIRQLDDDLSALDAAHRELDRLDGLVDHRSGAGDRSGAGGRDDRRR